MDSTRILSYIGIFILIVLFLYLTLRILGIVKSITVDQLLWGFVGGQLYFDLVIERRLSRLEGKIGLLLKKYK